MATSLHPIDPRWTMWAHLPQDTDWSSESYRLLMDITYVEELTELSHTLPDALLTSCMFFFMVQGVKPVWEDPKNRAGGCFSYKVSNKQVPETWRNVIYSLAGGVSSPDAGFRRAVTGCSLSPKKGFCIIKLWMNSTAFQNPTKVQIPGLRAEGCLFKRHGDP